MINNLVKRQKGFTLIEMMVAVSIFVIVAFIVVSTLLTMSAAYKKAQRIKLLFDNLNFAVQSMAIGLREGKFYNCSRESCSFVPIDRWLLNGEMGEKVCYAKTSRANGTFALSKFKGDCNSVNSQDMISPEINIVKLDFKTLGGSGQYKQVTIIIKGKAGTNIHDSADFTLQTTVSQRNLD